MPRVGFDAMHVIRAFEQRSMSRHLDLVNSVGEKMFIDGIRSVLFGKLATLGVKILYVPPSLQHRCDNWADQVSHDAFNNSETRGSIVINSYEGSEKYKELMNWFLVEKIGLDKNTKISEILQPLHRLDDNDNSGKPFLLVLNNFEDLKHHDGSSVFLKKIALLCAATGTMTCFVMIGDEAFYHEVLSLEETGDERLVDIELNLPTPEKESESENCCSKLCTNHCNKCHIM